MADAAPGEPPTAPPDEPAPATLDDSDFLPVGRDRRFVYRLVAALLLAFIAASFVAWQLKGAAASCGAGLVRPGSSVIPPEAPGR